MNYCSRHCRRQDRTLEHIDATTDWLACRIRQDLIKSSWSDAELARRSGRDLDEPTVETQVLPDPAIHDGYELVGELESG